MSATAIVLLVILAIVVVFLLAALIEADPIQRIDDHYSLETARQDEALANLLTELRSQNRETYRRIKEAGREA